jgi:hypothetical protein
MGKPGLFCYMGHASVFKHFFDLPWHTHTHPHPHTHPHTLTDMLLHMQPNVCDHTSFVAHIYTQTYAYTHIHTNIRIHTVGLLVEEPEGPAVDRATLLSRRAVEGPRFC